MALPSTQAHVEEFGSDTVFQSDTYVAVLSPDRLPIAGQTMEWRLIVQEWKDNRLGAASNATQISYTWTGPQEETLQGAFRHAANTTWEGSWLFPSPGAWNATITFENGARREVATLALAVYKDVGFRITPVNEELDAYVGNVTRLDFKLVWYDNERAQANQGPGLLLLTLESWTDDHSQMLGSEKLILQRTPDHTWAADVTFREPGMRHMRFTSALFDPDDVPTQHVFVQESVEPRSDLTRTLLNGLFLAVVAGGTFYLLNQTWKWWRDRAGR
ncbi:MAG: hypothetical protein AABX89_07490 [Candidatus Thermoplasmatota archaeon]